MKNADLPAMPQDDALFCAGIGECPTLGTGLTKREQFCLHMGVPETGDPELDDIIRKGERKRIAAMAMQRNTSNAPAGMISNNCMIISDALIKELEK